MISGLIFHLSPQIPSSVLWMCEPVFKESFITWLLCASSSSEGRSREEEGSKEERHRLASTGKKWLRWNEIRIYLRAVVQIRNMAYNTSNMKFVLAHKVPLQSQTVQCVKTRNFTIAKLAALRNTLEIHHDVIFAKICGKYWQHSWMTVTVWLEFERQVKHCIISIADLLFLVEYSRNTLQEWLLVATVKVSGFVFSCIFYENQNGRAWRVSWMIRAALVGRLWGPGARSRFFLIANEKQQPVSQIKYNTCANGRFPHGLMGAWCGSVSRFRSLLFRLMSLSSQTFQSIATERED